MRERILFFTAMLLLAWAATARAADDGRTDCIRAEAPDVIEAGGEAQLLLVLDGQDGFERDGQPYCSMQFDLTLPDGITLAQSTVYDDFDYNSWGFDVLTPGSTVRIADHGTFYRIIIYNASGNRLTGHEGTFLSLTMQAAESVRHGQLQGAISNQLLGMSGDENFRPAPTTFGVEAKGNIDGRLYLSSADGSAVTLQTGDTTDIYVMLHSDNIVANMGHHYCSAQFDLHSIGGYAELTLGDQTLPLSDDDGFRVSFELVGDGHYRVILYNVNGRPFNADTADERLLHLKATIPDDTPSYSTSGYILLVNGILGIDGNHNFRPEAETLDYEQKVYMVLNEMDLKLPDGFKNRATNQNILVRRTIKAGEWNTLCLPVGTLSAANLRKALGDDVEMASIKSVSIGDDKSVNIVFLSLGDDLFYNGEAIPAVLVRTSKDISSLRFDGVTLLGSTRLTSFGVGSSAAGTRVLMTGTYVYIDGETNTYRSSFDHILFLSGDKFYYSEKKVKMKAFRAYFAGQVIEDAIAAEAAGAKIHFTVDDEDVTSIDGVPVYGGAEVGHVVYTLQGQLVGHDVELKRLPKGVYIVDGMKVAIK